MRTLRIEIAPKTLLWVIATLCACAIALRLAPVFLVVIVALFLVGTLSPGVEWLQAHRIQRGWAITLVCLGSIGGVLLLAALTLPALFDQVRSLIENEPQLRNRGADLLSRYKLTSELSGSLRHLKYDALAKAAGEHALNVSTRVAEGIGYTVSVVFLAIYIMIDRDRLRGGMFALVARPYHLRMSRILINLETIVGGYIRGQALTSGLMALFTFGLLLACGVPNPLALAAFAGLADVLPYIGAALAIAPAAAAAAASGGVVKVIIVVAAMLAYQELESRLIVPRVYGRILRLPSSMVLLALLAGGVLGGVLGALMALPVAAAIRMLFRKARGILPGERIDTSTLRARDERAEQEYQTRTENMQAQDAAAIAMEIAFERMREEGGREDAIDVPLTAGLPH